MSIAAEESVIPLDDDQIQEIFREVHQRVGISVDFNSYELYGLQFWDKLESELIKSLEISSIADIDQGRKNLSFILKGIMEEKQTQLLSPDFDTLVDRLVDHYFGLGIVDSLLREESTYALLVNGFQEVYLESRGKLQKLSLSFWSDAHFRHVIDRLCIWNNVDLPSDKNPITTFVLPGNLLAMVLFPPVTLNAPCLSISSRFAKKPLTLDQLIQFGTLSADMLQFLKNSIDARLNILVCGHLGSGANTLVSLLSSFIAGDERVISIEYENEYALRINHLIKLMAKNDPTAENSFGKLLGVAGKIRGDRLVLGEFLSSDAYGALNSINDDFSGSILRITAKSPTDAINRLETFIQLHQPALPHAKIRKLISSSIDLIAYQERLYDGSRVVKNIVEVLDETDGNSEVALKEIFGVEQTGVKDGRILRRFVSYGHPSEKIMNKAALVGIEFPTAMFTAGADAERVKELTDFARRTIILAKGNYVFISYSTKDLNRIVPLARELEKNDFSVWLDKWYLEAGKVWAKDIEKAIKNAGVFLVILTPNSVDAEAVMSEIITAQEQRLPIIPVKMGECSAPIPIKSLQYILYDEHNVAATVHRISDALSKYISNQRLLAEN